MTHPHKVQHRVLDLALTNECLQADFEIVMLPSEHVPDNHKICAGCNQILPLRKFGKGMSTPSYCSECTRRLFYRKKKWVVG